MPPSDLLARARISFGAGSTDPLIEELTAMLPRSHCRVRKPAAIEKIVEAGGVDLLVLDINVVGDGMVDLCRRIRHGEVGANPFIAIIALATAPPESVVRRVVDGGFDDLVVRPTTAKEVLTRLVNQARNRRPFVVTTDYIGPDRRQAPRPGTQQIPLLEVPNPFDGRRAEDNDAYTKAIADMMETINEQKIERHAFQIGYLINHIVNAYMMHKEGAETDAQVDRLADVCRDMIKRLPGSNYDDLGALIASVLEVAQRIQAQREKPAQKDLDVLPNLARAIKRAMETAVDLSATAQTIHSEVSKAGRDG